MIDNVYIAIEAVTNWIRYGKKFNISRNIMREDNVNY